jgi:N-acetylmuramoyl-L-alanine amidase
MRLQTCFLLTFCLFLPLRSLYAFNNSLPSVKNCTGHHFGKRLCNHHAVSEHFHKIKTLSFPSSEEVGKYIKDIFSTTSPYKIKTIVIDPGHGGKDSGCLGSFSQEKHLALSIALKLGKHIESIYPDIHIIYTRKTDVFIPLHKRAEIANRNKADLFISVHCNYAEYSKRVNGTETYVMGLHTAEYNLKVAKRENASILLEENYQETYGGYDPNSPEGHILLTMFQNAFLEQSISFAEKVEKQFSQVAGRNSRGVKQAGFVVLKETAMPSVLIETGFLSNLEEEHYLFTERGQDLIASSVLRAFTEYKRELEEGNNQLMALPAKETPDLRETSPRLKEQPNTERPAPPPNNDYYSPSPRASRIMPVTGSLAQPEEAPKGSGEAKEEQEEDLLSILFMEDRKAFVQFKVQLMLSPDLVATNSPKWRKLDCMVEVKREGKQYKYLATGFRSFDEAVNAKNRLRENGFPEAFVVAFANGKRVPVKEALKVIRP